MGNKEYFKNYYLKNRNKRLLNDRCRRYKVSIEDIEYCFKSQKGRCFVCKEVIDRNKLNSWHVDHNHKFTGLIRGILCCHCNRLLGAAKDDVDILKSAINYLNLEFVAY